MAATSGSNELPGWIKDHLERYIATNGEDGYLWDATLGGGKGMIPTLLLTTTGRKSGRELTLPLIFGRSGADYVVVASKGGAPEEPAWGNNMRRQPHVELQDGADKRDYTARELSGDERTEWWARATEVWPDYDEYQKKTDRQIAIFVLEPFES